jgi:hypothetical protein
MSTTRKTQTDEAKALAAAEANTQAQDPQAAAEAQAALVQAQDEVLATVHPINGDQAQEPQGEALTDEERAALKTHTDELAAQAASHQATRATWRQHGNPLAGWEFFGTAVKTPQAKGAKVAKVEVDPQGVTLLARGGKLIQRFGSATKFWAVVPAEATRQQAPEPKAKVERTVAEGRTSAAERLAAALAGDSAHAPAPQGYEIRWPKGGYDLLKRVAGAPEGSPAWLVRCNEHNLTTPSEGGKAGDALGTKAGRLGWCSGCQAAAKAQAQAEAKAARAEAAKAAKAQADQAPKAEEEATPKA